MEKLYDVYQAYKEADDMLHVPGQDKGFVINRNNVVAMALCDGAGSASKSAEGAQEMSVLIANMLCDNWEKYLLKFPDAIRREIYINIRKKLTALSSLHSCKKEELASTIIGFATDGKMCIGVHLGDGEIISNDNGNIHILSYPVNGLKPNSTYLTTSKCAYRKIRVYKFSRKYTKYMLCTDGVDWRNTKRLNEIFEQENENDIYDVLRKEKAGDDASVITLHIE